MKNLRLAFCTEPETIRALNSDSKCFYLGDEFVLDDERYVMVFYLNENLAGRFKRNRFIVLKTEQEAKDILKELKEKKPNMETLYEDAIIEAVGQDGLYALREYHLIETCAMFDGRKLYAI